MSAFRAGVDVVVRPVADIQAIAESALTSGGMIMEDRDRERWGGPWRRAGFYAALAAMLAVAVVGLVRGFS